MIPASRKKKHTLRKSTSIVACPTWRRSWSVARLSWIAFQSGPSASWFEFAAGSVSTTSTLTSIAKAVHSIAHVHRRFVQSTRPASTSMFTASAVRLRGSKMQVNELLTVAERLERIISLKGTLGYDSADVVEMVYQYAQILREQANELEREMVRYYNANEEPIKLEKHA